MRTRSRSSSETRSPTVSCSDSRRAVRISMRDSRNSVGRAGLVGEPADAVLARGRAVARARDVFDLGAHAEQLRDVRVEARRPRAVRGERLRNRRRSVRTRSTRSGRPRGPRARSPGARLAPPDSAIIASSASGEPSDCSMLVISGIDGSASPPPAARRSVSAPPNDGAVDFEEPAELVVGAPGREVEQLVGGAGVAGVAQQSFGARRRRRARGGSGSSSHVLTPAK